ncbi:MAG: hypothetical protein M3506_01475 [Chloroflexota bacterium]|nr:hypothetical protein [Chloroflexota bacterium]
MNTLLNAPRPVNSIADAEDRPSAGVINAPHRCPSGRPLRQEKWLFLQGFR